MASNDYYHTAPSPAYNGSQNRARPPRGAFDPYSSHHAQSSSPYASPTVDSPYQAYEPSRRSSTSYFATSGGGRDHDQNPFSDQIPLRESPTKVSHDTATYPDYLPEDPAIQDAPSAGRDQRERRRRRKKGILERKIPWVVYTFTFIQVVVFIAEMVRNGVLTGTPIEIHPNFNPMIGPSPYVLINMGARYVPCMRATKEGLDPNLIWPCPNSTSNDLNASFNKCTLKEVCGFSATEDYTPSHLPNQWYRFIIPIFMHAGIIHISFNMLLQILLGRDMEKEIGSIRFFVVYISSGIFGFVLGGNFAPEGIASTGASGSLFGVIAILLLDLLYHWGERKSPWVDLAWILVDIGISFVLGLLPGLDNFSHIGGFIMGLVLGVFLLHTPDIFRRRVGADLPPYATVRQARKAMDTGGVRGFVKDPVGFFKGRKALWWVWWLVRVAALIGVLGGFIALLKNFYSANPTKCDWCRHLSCIDYHHWCDIGKLETQNQTQNPTSKRELFGISKSAYLGDFL